MIKIKTDIDEKAQKAFCKNAVIACIVSLIVGSVGLVSYIVLCAFFNSDFLDIMLVFSIPFGFGLVYLIFINKNIKKTAESKISNEYEFYDDFFTVASIKNGEEFAREKIYYKDLYKSKEKNEYIFVYVNKARAFIINKNAARREDLQAIKTKLKIEEKTA